MGLNSLDTIGKDSRLSIVPIAQFVVGIAGMVGVVIGGCAVLPVSSC